MGYEIVTLQNYQFHQLLVSDFNTKFKFKACHVYSGISILLSNESRVSNERLITNLIKIKSQCSGRNYDRW